MIILKNLKWSNWFSYGIDNYVDFENSTLTQVLGKNGTGKTSIIHIIEEVLFNKNSRGVKKADIMNRGAKFLNAILEFNVDNTAYMVKLERKSSAKVTLINLTNDEDISSHTATNTFKEIQRIIGMDFQTFTQLVYQNSKQGLEFLTSPDSARKKFLIALFRLDNYTNYYETFKRAFNESNLASRELEGKKSVLIDWVQEHKDTDFGVKPTKTEIDDKPLHIMLSEIRNLKDKKLNIEAENIKISKNNRARENFGNLTKPDPLGDRPIINNDLAVERTIIKKDIVTINKLLRDLKNLGDSSCNTCLQPIDTTIKNTMLMDATTNLEIKQTRLKACDKLIDAEDLLVSSYKTLKSEHDSYNLSERLVDSSIRSCLYVDSDIDVEISLIKQKYDLLKADINAVTKYNKIANEHNTKLEAILIDMEKNKHSLEDVKAKLSVISNIKSKLDVLKTVFSTKGLVSYKIDFLVKDLQDKINEYLVVLSDGRFQLNFMLQSDSINIGIIDNGIPVDISALSTGELSRVNVSTLLAIRALMSSLSNTKINLLFLDEILGVLDEQGKANLIDILLEEKDLNTFIVSHEYTHPLLDKLYITKDKGGSSIG